MLEIELDDWDSFEKLANTWKHGKAHAPVLYRGQADARWQLKSTLERFGASFMPVQTYLDTIRNAADAIQTASGAAWKVEGEEDNPIGPDSMPAGIECMAFLRQNGFPSPLLDWSRSPFIAAFFAFYGTKPDTGGRVAVFQFSENFGGVHSMEDRPTITTIGRWFSTDRKHHLQQSQYTVCRARALLLGCDVCAYVDHNRGFENMDAAQGTCFKYTIPVSEGPKVLERLKRFNITSYSLFETTPTLLEQIAHDLFVVGD